MAHELVTVPSEIPQEYRKTFSFLSGEVLSLKEIWREYKNLFGHSQARIDLLNEAGSFLICILHFSLFNHLVLSLCRLLDPAFSRDSGSKNEVPNLSFRFLQDKLEKDGQLVLARELKDLLATIKDNAEALQKRRHKNIAHNDYSVAISKEELLVSRDQIEKTLVSAEDFLKRFEEFFTKQSADSSLFDSGDGGDILLTRLVKARAYDRLVAQGKIPGDWRDQAELSDGVF